MKKGYLGFLFLISSLSSFAVEQEVKLAPTTVDGRSSYNGSVTENEIKNIVVITKEEIQKKQHKDLLSVFEDSPMTMVTHTQAGPLIALRGSGEKTVMRVKVLLDGTSINTVDDSMGVIPFNAIPVSSVEKIEIIPGGGITLYGSGSSSGVINIITKSGKMKDYGVVNVTSSSFNTYNVNMSKGLKLGKNIFANVAVEAEKGKGYRQKEEHKKYNVLGGFHFRLNDKNSIRIYGSQYKNDEDNTNELSIYDLKRNRRKAGDTLSKVKSDRHTFGVDYQYNPSEKLHFTANYNSSKFSRDITQDARPSLTFLPSIDFFDNAFADSDSRIDLVLRNVSQRLEGRFEENIDNARGKLDYSYANNKGKFTFGYDYTSHHLKRVSTTVSAPYNEYRDIGLLIHKKHDRAFSEERLKENPDMIIGYSTIAADSMYNNPEDYFLNGKIGEKGIEDFYIKKNKFSLEDKLAKKLYKYATPEMIADYEKKKGTAEEKGVTSLVMEIFKSGVDPMPMMIDINRWYQTDFRKEKVFSLIDQNKLVEKDGKKGVYVKNPASKENTFFEINENTTFEDFARIHETLNSPPITSSTFVSSRIDTKKTTDSFYLHNDYSLTDNFDIGLGLRYEKSKYSGTRKTLTNQIIKMNPGVDRKKFADSASETLDLYTQTSDVVYTERTDRGQDQPGFMILEKLRRLKELRETGQTIIPMVNLTTQYRKTEENIGGDISFSYKLNDTNRMYVKYERAFNTPLPTQMTNKTFDPIHKVRVYWESGIRTEKMNNFEIGFRGMLRKNISFSAAAFLSDTYDEIISVVKDGNSHQTREWRFINLDKTRRLGLELQSEQTFDKLRLKESVTYIHPKILANNYKDEVMRIANEQMTHLIDGRRKSIREYFNNSDMKKMKEKERIIAAIDHFYQEEFYQKNIADKEKINHFIEEYVQKNINPFIDNSSDVDNETKKYLKDGIKNNLENDRNYVSIIREQYDYEYSLTNGSFLEEGERIPLAPKVKATFGADYQFTDKLRIGMNTTYIGSYISVEPARVYEIIKTKVPAHFVSDIYGTYHCTEDFSIKFGVNNIFNHQYNLRQDSYTATPAPGRTYSAGFSYRF